MEQLRFYEIDRDYIQKRATDAMLAWDPDFTRLTEKERRELEEARLDGELVSHEEINWD